MGAFAGLGIGGNGAGERDIGAGERAIGGGRASCPSSSGALELWLDWLPEGTASTSTSSARMDTPKSISASSSSKADFCLFTSLLLVCAASSVFSVSLNC